MVAFCQLCIIKEIDDDDNHFVHRFGTKPVRQEPAMSGDSSGPKVHLRIQCQRVEIEASTMNSHFTTHSLFHMQDRWTM